MAANEQKKADITQDSSVRTSYNGFPFSVAPLANEFATANPIYGPPPVQNVQPFIIIIFFILTLMKHNSLFHVTNTGKIF